jgi:hypothetical protein
MQGGVFVLEAANATLSQFLVTAHIELRELLAPQQDVEAEQKHAKRHDDYRQ